MRLQTLLSNYRVLEARLEAGGVSTKALQIQPMDIDLEGVRALLSPHALLQYTSTRT